MTKFEQTVYDLCVEITAHAEKDWEVTIGGNGTNCAEANNVANYLLEEMAKAYGSEAWGDKLLDDVAKKIKELEEYAGYI